MSEAKDALLRLFALLRLTPEFLGHLASATLLDKLNDWGFCVDMRAMQRNVNRHWGQVSLAVLEHCQLQVNYLSRSNAALKPMRLHSVGFISRHSIGDLIARVDSYPPVILFAMRRIPEAGCLELPAIQHSEVKHLDGEVDEGELNSARPFLRIGQVVNVSPQMLGGTPLCMSGCDWGRLRLLAPKGQETLWWTSSLNENICAHAPRVWMSAVKEELEQPRQLCA